MIINGLEVCQLMRAQFISWEEAVKLYMEKRIQQHEYTIEDKDTTKETKASENEQETNIKKRTFSKIEEFKLKNANSHHP